MASGTFWAALWTALLAHAVLSSKLNVPRVLLPIFNDYSTKFTLEATEGGCYKWSTTRSDLINLTPHEVDPKLDCSAKLVVSTITREKTRNIAVVLAEDVHTRQVLRCDVVVDVIKSLAIVTTTRELFMEEAPEAFEVRAYDGQGNEFSTLEGIEFDWTIVHLGPHKNLVIVRFMTFKDSPYETPPTIEMIEEENKHGHIVLLEGLKTGSVKVIVRLPQEEYADIKPHEVQLSIVANLIIHPAVVYIMAGDVVCFQVLHMNSGRLDLIELQNSQYYLDVESKSVASVEQDTGKVTGLEDGRTKVILHDRNIDDSESGVKLPSAVVNVVTPAYMTLSILPYRNWAVLLSEHHDIVAEVYSSNDHKLYLGEGVEIHTQIGDLFHVQERSVNGSWLTGWAKKEGMTPIQSVLQAVVHPTLGRFDLKTEISAHADLLVFPPIILNPSEIILPWDAHLKPKYEIPIRAMGGDGKFLWSSSNHSIGVVTQTGFVRTYSHGYFEVSAAMMINHHNRQQTKFHILPPSRLEIVEFVMEAEVGSPIHLHVALYADKYDEDGKRVAQIPFTKCQDLPFKVKPADTNFIYNKSALIPSVGISCANVAIVGINVGVSKVTVTYYSEGESLEDSVTVSTFKPLRLLHPRQCEIVLAVGTSVHLIFTGGPRPIVGRPSLHKRTVISNNNTVVTAEDITDLVDMPGKQDHIILNVLCLKLGSSQVTLSVTNSPIVPNCKNQESSSVVTVICGKPRSLFLQPEVKVADIHSCPMDLSADRVVVQSYKTIELDVAVTDEVGRRFLNVSSLKFEWKISPERLGELGSLDNVFSRNTTDGSVIYANRSYQTVTPKSASGIIEVTGTVVGYRKDQLSFYDITPEWPEFVTEDEREKELLPIATGIHLYLVNDTVVTPNEISIYNHPGNKKVLKVDQGSGYYELALTEDSIAEVKYLEETHQIEVIPINDGDLRIDLIDLCLVSQPAIILVHVVSVHIVRVEMSDKVEINKCISCVVRLYDEADNLLPLPDLGMVSLNPSLEDNIATVNRLTEDKKKPWPIGEIHFIVTGKELGDTKLTFSIGEVHSAAIDLQVFPPLRIFPRNATLLLGSVLHFTSTGGPQPDSTVDYSSLIKNIADVSVSGLAQGLTLGHTKIHARAVGVNPTTGSKMVYSQDTVDLQVIDLSGIKISIPLTRFCVGASVPAWASAFSEAISPMILGSVEPAIKFEWTVDDPEVISIRGSFKDYGIEYSVEDNLSIHVTGLIPGHTILHLNAIVGGVVADKSDRLHVVYSTSVDIDIFEGLALSSPDGINADTILMAPKTTLQLETNKDGINKLYYSLPMPDESVQEDNDLKKSLSIPNPIISISEKGLIQSYATLGRAMVVITSVDEFGLKQTLNLIVEVKPVHYMLLNVVANWHVANNELVNIIPLGVEFELRATYHDNIGTTFTAGNAELKLRSSRFDLVRIRPGSDNSSVIVSTKKTGSTLLKVWAEGNQNTVEYLKLHVGQVITPVMDHLTTGDILCVWTPLVTLIKRPGQWSSSERNLITLDANTGIGRVTSVRGGQVYLSHSLHPSALFHLQVVPASQIIMLPKPGKRLINAPDASVYRVPLVIVSEKSQNKMTNLINGWYCQEELESTAIYHPFTCHLAFSNNSIYGDVMRVFQVKTGFDHHKGQYTCDILPGVDYSPNTSTLLTNITVWAELEGNEVLAEPVELHFTPAIFVEPVVILQDATLTGILSVIGLDYVLETVTVKAVDKNLVYVGEPQLEDNVLKYDISLLDYHWKLDELDEPLNVIVKSKLTNQIVKVHVKTHSLADFTKTQCSVSKYSPLATLVYNYRYPLTVILAMCFIFGITYNVYAHYFNSSINVSMYQSRSLLNSSSHIGGNIMTPGRSGCAVGPYIQRTNISPSNRNSFVREPVYGDPHSFYSTSPELRRNRRIM